MAKFKVGDKAKWFNFNVVILNVLEDDEGLYYEVTATDFDAPFPVWTKEEKLREI